MHYILIKRSAKIFFSDGFHEQTWDKKNFFHLWNFFNALLKNLFLLCLLRWLAVIQSTILPASFFYFLLNFYTWHQMSIQIIYDFFNRFSTFSFTQIFICYQDFFLSLLLFQFTQHDMFYLTFFQFQFSTPLFYN